MPLPHFLILLLAVILAAALTLWAASALGVAVPALALLLAAGLVRLAHRRHQQN
ncbi:hypothetical protein [Paracoccus sp. (in: a-proteobacteria)]|uniref:hypothetical protein n=1 Tax=Paracoccus sp. TaxID=267 RepID=UPI0032202240